MGDWLSTFLISEENVQVGMLARRYSLAFLLGLAVAGIYWLTQRRGSEPKEERSTTSLISTLVLLSILIAMVTQVIGDNLARAFGLVGALSIVRFRTVVEDTRDTAFVIFAVVVGMAVGADHAEVALVGLIIVGVAALVTRPRRRLPDAALPCWSLTLRVGIGRDPDALLHEVFRKYVEEFSLQASATGRQGAALDVSYRVRLRPTSSPAAVVGELNGLEGIQSVELRRL
jgi:hypothetical protein